jgi:hypothetical protein
MDAFTCKNRADDDQSGLQRTAEDELPAEHSGTMTLINNK